MTIIYGTKPEHMERGIWSAASQLIVELGKETDKIVDLGAGKHRWSLGKLNKVVTVDIKSNIGVDIIWNLNKDLPFEDGTFDGALAMEVIEHLENPFHFLREMFRVTKHWIVVTTPDPDTPEGSRWVDEAHFYSHQHIMRVPLYLVLDTAIKHGFIEYAVRYSDSGANYIVGLVRYKR